MASVMPYLIFHLSTEYNAPRHRPSGMLVGCTLAPIEIAGRKTWRRSLHYVLFALPTFTSRRCPARSRLSRKRRVPCIARPMPSWPRPFEGLTTEESIYQACIKRFHPILMTTMAALLGGVPMMVCKGGSALKLGSRSATPSSAASPCRRFSPFIPRRSSIFTSTNCRTGYSEKRGSRP